MAAASSWLPATRSISSTTRTSRSTGCEAGAQPRRITDASGTRFADFALDAPRQRLIAVAEIHARQKGARHALPRNALVAIALSGKAGQIAELAAGRDFYASPRLSPDGKQLAFLAWDLPDMPWDSAALYVATLGEDGKLGRPKKIAGGDGSAVFQPEWGPDGRLYFVWDQTGWGQLYRWQDNKIVRVHGARGAELARPQWVFGSRSYALHPDGRVGMVSLRRGYAAVRGAGAEGRQGHPLCQAAEADCAHRRSRCLRLRFCRADRPPTAAPAIMRMAKGGLAAAVAADAGGDRARLASARARCASSAAPTGKCVRHLLRAEERYAPGSARGRSAGARSRARRAHVHDRCGPEAARPVLHQPRLCRARRQLFGQHRLRPRLPPTPRRCVGHRRRRRLRGGRAASGQGRSRRRGAHRHRRRQRRRLHDADGARHYRSVRRRQQPLRRVGFGPAARAHAQVRVGLSASPDGHHAGQVAARCSPRARPST